MILAKAIKKIAEINKLIANKDRNKRISDNYTLHSMREHVEEISELFQKDEGHWAAEAADLVIHCLLMLQRNGFNVDAINGLINRRCLRFKERINSRLN